MIITRTPFRISFSGGGSDIESFYKQHEGCVLSTSINKYMYISVHPYFEKSKIVLKYSQTEIVDHATKIEHKILGYALQSSELTGIEITSTADIPAGTGLGSSSAFTVGLLHALNTYQGKDVSKHYLADAASDLEINGLHSPIGKQDQFAAAFGGLNFIRFLSSGDTIVEPVTAEKTYLDNLQNNLIMLYTGDVRDANKILSEQAKNMSNLDKTKGLIKMCELTYDLRRAIERSDLEAFGEILHANWQIKKELAKNISNSRINEYYEKALQNGAKGGKLLGAGGGGFLLFYCQRERQQELKDALQLRDMPFKFENCGSCIVYDSREA